MICLWAHRMRNDRNECTRSDMVMGVPEEK